MVVVVTEVQFVVGCWYVNVVTMSVFSPDAAGYGSGGAGAAILTLSVPVFPCPGHYHKTILPLPPPPGGAD